MRKTLPQQGRPNPWRPHIHFFTFFAVIFPVFSCSFVKEFQKMEPPKVISYLPDRSCLKPSDVSEIRLHFSAPMDIRSTEEAFALKASTTPLPGVFHWEKGDRTLIYTPLSPLRDKETYTLFVSTTAEDKWGNSLIENFHRTFHTKEETTPPQVLTAFPDPTTKVTDVFQPVGFSFSEPMDQESILRSFSLTPSVPGTFSFFSDSHSFMWSPMEPYRPGEVYRVFLRKDACDTSGNCLTEDYRFSFQVSQAETALLSITCLSSGKRLAPVSPETYVDPALRIEKTESFRIRFASPIDSDSRDSILTLYPATPYRTEWNSAGDEVVLSFPDMLSWNAVYELQVLSSMYRFRVDGPQSIPPAVRRILYLPDATGDLPTYEELLFCHNYTFSNSACAAFDIYLSLSPTASIVTSSFLSSFAIETGNGCLDLRLLRVEKDPIYPPPQTFPPVWEGEIPLKVEVFRVYCRITPVFGLGTVTFSLRRDLQDDLGNHLPHPYTLIVNKQ